MLLDLHEPVVQQQTWVKTDDVLACNAAHRLFKRSRLGIVHFTLLLVLFGAAAAKAQHTPLLTAMLASELPSVFYLLGKLQARDLSAGMPLTCSFFPRSNRQFQNCARMAGSICCCMEKPRSSHGKG